MLLTHLDAVALDGEFSAICRCETGDDVGRHLAGAATGGVLEPGVETVRSIYGAETPGS